MEFQKHHKLFASTSRSLPGTLTNKVKGSRVARKNDVLKAEEYLNFQGQAQEMAGREAENDNPWLKNMLETFYGETDHIRVSETHEYFWT